MVQSNGSSGNPWQFGHINFLNYHRSAVGLQVRVVDGVMLYSRWEIGGIGGAAAT